jgi:UDP-2,4-diacetamido-2,4,6-trideoxy-beta-L-altropyranose hydrolase
VTVAEVVLRACRPHDCAAIFAIANDPTVRAMAFSPDPIPWESHVGWFRRALETGGDRFFVTEVDGTIAGYVRFDQEGIVSIAVGGPFRGQGVATRMLREAVLRLVQVSPAPRITAYVKPENLASQRTFAAAGFRDDGETVVQGHACRRWVRSLLDDDDCSTGGEQAQD